MLVRYLPVILVLIALVLALAPLETAGQSSPNSSAQGARKADKPSPKTVGAPVKTGARQMRPAQAFPPERIAPSNIQALDRAEAPPARKDDPRSVEERADPGGS